LPDNVPVIGLLILSRTQTAKAPRALELQREKRMEEEAVVAGKLKPGEDGQKWKQPGVAAVFRPGTSLEGIVSNIRSAVRPS
jgi:methylmalonyl-CoA mutase C-terminal domain/subunit